MRAAMAEGRPGRWRPGRWRERPAMEGGEEGGVAAGERGGRSRWGVVAATTRGGRPAEMAWTRDGRARMRDGDDGQRSTRRRRAAQGRGNTGSAGTRTATTRGGDAGWFPERSRRGRAGEEGVRAVISGDSPLKTASMEIGRASCRERVLRLV